MPVASRVASTEARASELRRRRPSGTRFMHAQASQRSTIRRPRVQVNRASNTSTTVEKR
ncbi:hypothetical protein D3C80_750200 [compost metagenome]